MTNELESYKTRCFEPEKKSKNDEKRYLMLQVEVENLKNKHKVLEGKIMKIREVVEVSDGEDEVEKLYDIMTEMKVLECEKQKAESEVYKLKEKVSELLSRVYELESGMNKHKVLERKIKKIREVVEVSDGEDEVEKLYDMMTEMKVLECEKQKAESEVYKSKEKVIKLMSQVYGLESSMNEKVKKDVNVVSRFSSKVRKRLPFEDNGCSSKKLAPSTPGVVQTPFFGVIDISDEDVNYDETPENKNISDSSNHGTFKKTNLEDFDEEDSDDLKFRSWNGKSGKRKRAANIISSDDETSDVETTYDDNALICTLIKPLSSRPKIDSRDEVTEGASKRCLKRLRKLGSNNKQDISWVNQNKTVFIDGNSSTEDGEDADVEGSESDQESLSEFINDSPDIVSESESASESSDNIEEPENVLNDYKETIDNIRRKKVSNFKWELQGEMQADFGKDPELCMRAVCALYRKQTEDEKACKETIHYNKRGFSQPDANWASSLAEFLTDGDPKGDLNKTVEELERYDPEAIELCRSLALKYSKQLFLIYQNKEDPYFPPR